MASAVYASSVHYVSDNVFSLGSLCCAVCGHQFPLTASPHTAADCSSCGTPHRAGSHLDLAFRQRTNGNGNGGGGVALDAALAAARFFTPEEIAEAVEHVAMTVGNDSSGSAGGDGDASGGGGVTVGQTAVDNRVLEEAFCEKCSTHRSCKTFARQTRGADEGQTIFFQCTVCNAEWQQNS